MPTYKLTYFDVTGLGEAIRILLHQSGIKFEDKRVTFEEWPQLKSQMPLRQLPVLEIDDKVYYQSKAIGRLIARQNNLAGSTDDEAFLADATVDTLDDVRMAFTQYHWEQDDAAKEKLKKIALDKLSLYFGILEEQVKKNNGHLVNGKLTWADIVLVAYTDFLKNLLGSDTTKEYPELKKLVEKVKALPKIKAYLDKRPKTMF